MRPRSPKWEPATPVLARGERPQSPNNAPTRFCSHPMIFFKAQQMQQLARLLMRLETLLERVGGDASHELEESLEDAAERTGVHLEILRLAGPETIEEVLAPGGGGDPGKVWGAAEVLFLDGLLAHAQGRAVEARDRLEKAHRLYLLLEPDLELPDEAVPPAQRIRSLRELLE